MRLVEYRGGESIVANRPLPEIGSVGMIIDEKEGIYRVEFPYRCFKEIVKEEELIVILTESQFVNANNVLLDAINEWVEKKTKEVFEEYMTFMQKYGDDEEKIKELFGEEMGEKMLDFYKTEVKSS